MDHATTRLFKPPTPLPNTISTDIPGYTDNDISDMQDSSGIYHSHADVGHRDCAAVSHGLSFVPECEDAIAFRVEKWQGTGRSLPRGWGPPGGGPARRHHCRRLPARCGTAVGPPPIPPPCFTSRRRRSAFWAMRLWAGLCATGGPTTPPPLPPPGRADLKFEFQVASGRWLAASSRRGAGRSTYIRIECFRCQ